MAREECGIGNIEPIKGREGRVHQLSTRHSRVVYEIRDRSNRNTSRQVNFSRESALYS